MNLIKLIVLSALGALLLNSAAFAQPAHAPAHGARDKGYHQESHQTRHVRGEWVDLPRTNERELRHLLRQQDAPRAEALPPGIQRNLERGKPLPPGIAKRFDGQIASQLPYYPGYEWERVGADVVLIEAATRIVVDVIADVLR
ncbi:anti-virulence regulator CigR family protein [Halomonas sp. SpR8]|uniref:anti-virulence regulator CigR family protein n=1 Tax=Halomonas sp. SpR8 TaxID=3050463 RepID=UPI0027E420F6|nr:anti-virulence regulator CigR family protein [Halomonas sp. SpR8]MDQ7730078.1 anti-virulence regulator CigR family protein [Halomonas sp. SpR8]